MSKNYIFAYKGIVEANTKLRETVNLPALPEFINAQGTELLDYLKALKNAKDSETLDRMSEMLVDRAILPAETFYTDVVGHSPNYNEEIID